MQSQERGQALNAQHRAVGAHHQGGPIHTAAYLEHRPIAQSFGCVLKVCDCITIEAEGKGKTARIRVYEIDYTKCLFCALCCEPCPTVCIHMGPTFDLVGYTRDEVIINYADRDNPRTFSGDEKLPYEIAPFVRK